MIPSDRKKLINLLQINQLTSKIDVKSLLSEKINNKLLSFIYITK